MLRAVAGESRELTFAATIADAKREQNPKMLQRIPYPSRFVSALVHQAGWQRKTPGVQ